MGFNILMDKKSMKSVLKEKRVQTYINKMPRILFNALKQLHINILICDVAKMTNVVGKGCYFVKDNQIFIYLDNSSSSLKKTFYHELGHLFDDLLGCYYNQKQFQSNNKPYRFSLTNEDFAFYNKQENDFWLQCSIKNEDIFQDDLSETFADSFAELILGYSRFSMQQTKSIIYQHLTEYLNQIG